jgi:hypothetical protein
MQKRKCEQGVLQVVFRLCHLMLTTTEGYMEDQVQLWHQHSWVLEKGK